MPVAVMKYANADVGLSCPAPSSAFRSRTESTETICAMQGRTPATACPVMIPCMYSATPSPLTYANNPFCVRLAAQLAVKTMIMRNPK